jgi:hypothetical protein
MYILQVYTNPFSSMYEPITHSIQFSPTLPPSPPHSVSPCPLFLPANKPFSHLSVYENQHNKQNLNTERIGDATQGNLTLNQKTVPRHLPWLLQAHSLEDRGGDVTENTVGLLQAPAFGRVGHDEGDFVGCVGGLGFAIFEFHFFGVSGIKSSVVFL